VDKRAIAQKQKANKAQYHISALQSTHRLQNLHSAALRNRPGAVTSSYCW